LSISQNSEKSLGSDHLSIQEYLVKRCKDGDRQAQGELYDLYKGAMYNTARRIVGDEDDARDILQDSFIQAFTKITSLKNEITFGAWLKRIVVNTSLNFIKKHKRFVDEYNENIEIEEPTFKEADFQQTEAKRIMKAIDEISEGCRTVLNLYLFEGYDHKEIGQILGISESASKAQYSKAKSKIRKRLSEYE